MPAGYNLNKVVEQIRQEQSTAQNIKSKTVRKNVLSALEKILQHLKLYKETPENGLAIFCGNVAEKEGTADIELWAIEPIESLKQRLYRCDQYFILDPLKEIIREREIYGLIVLDKSDAEIGLLKGKKILSLKHLDSIVPGKTDKGGWCVHADTLLQLNDGRICKIKDLGNERFLCYNFNTFSPMMGKHNHVFSRKSDEVYEITTVAPSLKINVTPEHKFFVLRSNGIGTKHVAELRQEDNLLAIKKIEIKGKLVKFHIKIPSRYTITKQGIQFLIKKRLELSLLQREVARKLNLSQTAISKFELRKRNLKKENLKKLLSVYRLDEKKFSGKFIKNKALVNFPKTLNKDLAQILGYILGDGNRDKYRITLSEEDKLLIKKYKRKAEKSFNVSTSLRERKSKGYWELRINSKYLLEVLEKLFPKILIPFKKKIPNVICTLPNHELSYFIKGLYDAEGSIDCSSKTIDIAMNSIDVIKTLQILLLRFGIISSFGIKKPKGSFAKKLRYSLRIGDYNSTKNFATNIGFSSSKKKGQFRKILRNESKLSYIEQIPVRGSHILTLLREIRMNTDDFPKVQDFFFDKKSMSYRIFKRNILQRVNERIEELELAKNVRDVKKLRDITRMYLKDIGKELGMKTQSVYWHIDRNPQKILKILQKERTRMVNKGKSILALLNKILKSELISVRIKSIKKAESNSLFYDIEVPRYKSFIANGLILHNSQARYARIREGLLNDFLKEVGEIASQQLRSKKDLKGVIIGGPAGVKDEFSAGDFLHYEIKNKVLGVVNTSYTGKYGLEELVNRSQDILTQASITREKNILNRFFTELAKGDLAIYGIKETLQALKSGSIETLLISEGFDFVKVSFECKSCGNKIQKLVRKDQVQQCPKCNSKLDPVETQEILDEIIELAEKMNTNVEIISVDTREGEQLKELGCIAGILRYKV